MSDLTYLQDDLVNYLHTMSRCVGASVIVSLQLWAEPCDSNPALSGIGSAHGRMTEHPPVLRDPNKQVVLRHRTNMNNHRTLAGPVESSRPAAPRTMPPSIGVRACDRHAPLAR